MKKQLHFIFLLSNFLKLCAEAKLTFKTAYKLKKLSEAVAPEQAFFQQKLKEIFDEYAERDENNNFIPTNDGKGIKIIPEKLSECEEKIQELYTVEITLPEIWFSADEFENMELTVTDMEGIIPFIKD